jgi:osmotically-inducible protein OsmY
MKQVVEQLDWWPAKVAGPTEILENGMRQQTEVDRWVPLALEFEDDDQLCAAVRAALAESDHRALRRLHCQAVDGVVILLGRVASFYLKQLAQTLVRSVEGARGVINLLEVHEPALAAVE